MIQGLIEGAGCCNTWASHEACILVGSRLEVSSLDCTLYTMASIRRYLDT